MKFEELTHNDAVGDVAARTRDDWCDRVSATMLRDYLLNNTLGDWLDLYGAARGFASDQRREGYDERLDSCASSRIRTSRRSRGGRLCCRPKRADPARSLRAGRLRSRQREGNAHSTNEEHDVIRWIILWSPENLT